jgi:hypothetical protein
MSGSELDFDWGALPSNYTLANPAHCAWLASSITRKLATFNKGGKATLKDREAIHRALDACTFHGYPPPRELTDLVADALNVGPNAQHRDGVQDRGAFDTAARIKGERGLAGRSLAKAVREAGFPVADRTVASWEKQLAVKKGDDGEPAWHRKGWQFKAQMGADFEALRRRYAGEDED